MGVRRSAADLNHLHYRVFGASPTRSPKVQLVRRMSRATGDDAEGSEQPKDHNDYHDDVDDLLDAILHRDVCIDESEYNSDYN